MPHELHFLRPEWLLLLIPMGFLLWRLARATGDENAWRSVVDAHLLPRLLSGDGGSSLRLPLLLLGIAWLIALLALAGPVWRQLPQPVYQAQQYRVIALDLSPSMNAGDLPPSRLTHARFEVLDLLRKAQDGQTALIAYGAEPYVVSPLTSDSDTIAAQVPSLSSSLLPVRGARRTDLVLEKAEDLLRQAGAPDGEVILITDGLARPALANAAARKLRAAGYRVSVLGVGSAKGAPVPLAEGGFLKDDQGAILLPKLDQGALSALAEQGGGRYVSAGLDDRDIEMLMPPPAAELTQQTQKQDTQADQWREEGPWLLVLLLPLAALAFRRGWLAPLVLLAALTPLPEAHAFGWDDLWLNPDQQAQRLMQAGQSQAAAETFQRPDWRAAAHYEAGDYQQALDALEGLQDRRADYNRGNALAHVGQLEQALAAYEQALEKDPEDQDARHNRDLVKKLLDQKQQQEQEDQQQQQGQQGQKDQQDQQGQQGQEDQQQQQGQQGQADQQQQQGQQGREDQQEQQGQQGQENQQDQQGQQGQEDQQDQQGQQGQEDQQDQQGQQGQENQQDQENQQAGREPEEASSDEATPRNQDAQPEQSRQASSEDAEAPSSQSPDIDDLLGREPGSASPVQSADAEVDAEDRQAMEQMLRRVEDDPAGLLRQRFLLQHLRRNGQLP